MGRGTCSFIEKALNAQAAGAVAMVVVNSLPDSAVVMGGPSAGASQVTVACVMMRTLTLTPTLAPALTLTLTLTLALAPALTLALNPNPLRSLTLTLT